MVSFFDAATGGSRYADYDQPWGYPMALYNQLFNGGYEGVPTYTGTLAHTSASRDSTENLEVFGSVRAYFHQVHGEDIVRFRILNECENDPCRATDEPVWIQLNATRHANTKEWYATHAPSEYWDAAEAAACANLTLPVDFPLENPCGTTPAASAATLLANKVVYLYPGVTFTRTRPARSLHPQVNFVTAHTTDPDSIGARYVMGEREGFGWDDHDVDQFAGIGTHVHEIGHLFGLHHPTGTWTGTNPHTDPPQTRSFRGANASAWGQMQNSLLHGPEISTPDGFSVSHASCPQPFNPFYRMDLGWDNAHTISETTLNRRIEPGPGDYYVVHSDANSQDYILDFRMASNFGQYTSFHRFTASPGLLIWRRSPSDPTTPRNNAQNPMVIPADGRSIFDAREDEEADPQVPTWRDRLSDPFGAPPDLPHGPTVTQATDASHLTHSTSNNRLINRPSRLAFRNIRNEGTHALVDIYVNYWSGPITTTTNWSGRVTVGGDVTIASGATLTLAAGTEVRFLANNDDTGSGDAAARSELIVEGTLTAVESGISFGSAHATPSNDDWYGIRVESGGTATLTNVTVSDGVHCAKAATGGTLTSSGVTLSNCGTPPTVTGSAAPEFAERGEGTVATYSATDAEDDPVTWSLVDENDDDAFSIDPQQGVLRFGTPPNYEEPTAVGHASDADLATRNVYTVTVLAEDGQEASTEYEVSVTVTDMDEPGTVSLSPTTPQVGKELKAVLHDPDGVENPQWRWLSSAPAGSREADETATGEASLMPSALLVGKRLQAKVTYDDRHRTGQRAPSAATAPVVDVPSAPRNLEAAAGNARVELRWDPPLTDNGSAVTGYEYRQSADGGVTWSPDWGDIPGSDGSTTRHTVRDLTNGLEYTFEVRAVNGAGEGASASDTATPRRPDTRGRVEWSTTQPRVGQELTPTLIDPDNPALAEARWRWRRLGWLRSDAGDSLSAPAPGSRSGESKLVSCRVINCTNN